MSGINQESLALIAKLNHPTTTCSPIAAAMPNVAEDESLRLHARCLSLQHSTLIGF